MLIKGGRVEGHVTAGEAVEMLVAKLHSSSIIELLSHLIGGYSQYGSTVLGDSKLE